MGEQSGRETNGQFGAGNRFGPGNPFARKVAELRAAAVRAVTAEDIDGILRALKLKAQAGDVAAARLILSYTVGRPGAPADPDTLEAHELRVRRESVPAEADWDAMHAVPASLLNPLARACVVASRERYRKMILDGPPAPAPAKEGPAGRPGLSKGLAQQLQARTTPITRPSSAKAANRAQRPPKSPNASTPVSDGGRQAPSPNGEKGPATAPPARSEAASPRAGSEPPRGGHGAPPAGGAGL